MACALCVCAMCAVSVDLYRFTVDLYAVHGDWERRLLSFSHRITKSEKNTPENLWTEKILKSHSASTRSRGWKREEINAKCTQFIFETRSSLAVDYYHPPVDCVIFAHAIIQNGNWNWNRNFFLMIICQSGGGRVEELVTNERVWYGSASGVRILVKSRDQ